MFISGYVLFLSAVSFLKEEMSVTKTNICKELSKFHLCKGCGKAGDWTQDLMHVWYHSPALHDSSYLSMCTKTRQLKIGWPTIVTELFWKQRGFPKDDSDMGAHWKHLFIYKIPINCVIYFKIWWAPDYSVARWLWNCYTFAEEHRVLMERNKDSGSMENSALREHKWRMHRPSVKPALGLDALYLFIYFVVT
jgi:hypothetical protein